MGIETTKTQVRHIKNKNTKNTMTEQKTKIEALKT
jgi:hypothetical protein